MKHTTALILIDFINEIVAEGGKLAGKGYHAHMQARGSFAKINEATVKARAAGIPIIWVRVGFSPDYREWPESSPLFGAAKQYGALQLGTPATEIHSDLTVDAADYQVIKHRVSAFYATSLEAVLRTIGASKLLIGGVATDLAVQSAVREAHDRDFEVVVLEDCCAAACDADHEQAVGMLSKVAVVKSAEEALG